MDLSIFFRSFFYSHPFEIVDVTGGDAAEGRGQPKYTKRTSQKAIAEIKSGAITAYGAEKKYEVSRVTLHRQLNGTFKNVVRGAKQILSENHETRLANWIIQWSESGHPKTRLEICETAAKLAKLDGKPGFKNYIPTISWFKRFVTKHPNITHHTLESQGRTTVGSSDSELSEDEETESMKKDEKGSPAIAPAVMNKASSSTFHQTSPLHVPLTETFTASAFGLDIGESQQFDILQGNAAGAETSKLILKAREAIQNLGLYLRVHDPSKLLNILVMNQQLNIIEPQSVILIKAPSDSPRTVANDLQPLPVINNTNRKRTRHSGPKHG